MSIFKTDIIYVKEESLDNDHCEVNVENDHMKREILAEGSETEYIKTETNNSKEFLPSSSVDGIACNSSTDGCFNRPNVKLESIKMELIDNNDIIHKVMTNRRDESINMYEENGSPDINKRYKCRECDYSNYLESKLKLHINAVHRKLKPFKCLLCKYAAGHKSNLRHHINSVHSTVKAFQCAECHYCTSHGTYLRKHVNAIHRKLKTFPCQECGYAARHSADLRKHVDAVHRKLKAFQCPECGYAASIKCNVKKHVNAVHRKLKQSVKGASLFTNAIH